MKKLIQSVIILFYLVRTGFSEGGSRLKVPVKRSYQLPHVAVVNDAQGFQYYGTGPFYTIPAVIIPNQIGLSATPITSVVLPPSSEPKPTQEFQETSTPAYTLQKPTIISNQLYKQKHRSHGFVQGGKRPVSYVNSIYGPAIRVKPLSSVPSHKTKVSSLSIQPSVDLSGQFSQEAASNLYPTTVGPPVVSTYGPPKAVDFQYKTRLSGIGGQTVYHKLKGPSHRHSYYPVKKMRVYSHVHKDHIHNHYIPSSHPFPVYKPQQPTKYSGPAYLPPASSTPPTFTQESTPEYHYQTNTHVKFPDHQQANPSPVTEPSEVHKPNYSSGEVTQAIIKNPGVINNYDANIPLHVPSKKPYQFEVNEILKNSELHFVQEVPGNKNNEHVGGHGNGLLQYTQTMPYQNAVMFGTRQPLYTPLAVDQSNIIAAPNPLDIYSLQGINPYHTNHIMTDQDSGTSETVKMPVAVIRGPHDIANQGMFGFTVKRQDESISQRDVTKKTFTPSKKTSDWIPMSGSGLPLVTKKKISDKQSEDSAETFSGDYYSTQTTQKETKPVRQPIGDIIMGKIPEKYAPKTGREGDIVKGKINFIRNSSDGEKRKGSVIDVYPSSNPEVINTGDTSDLVVSSVSNGKSTKSRRREIKKPVMLAEIRSIARHAVKNII